MTAYVDGFQPHFYQAQNLIPGTTYVFTVQGCDVLFRAQAGGNDCATSSPYTATAASPAPAVPSLPIATVPPQLSLSVPTVTAGNTVKVTGQAFADSGDTVTLTLSSSGSPVTLGM
ncbi:MAG TPA: hypothetical protein VK821_18435, partial [Dehalococcoidia bacterium]|nr:hypothetical protein [Dehalococcoidia bacterium]